MAAVVADLRDAEPEDDGHVWVAAHASDDTYRADNPESPWSAGWHRAAMGRVAEALPTARVYYIEGGR